MTTEIFWNTYQRRKKGIINVPENFMKEKEEMQINTKYEIGTHIWIVDVNTRGGELFLYDTNIIGITADKTNWFYMADDDNYVEIKEEDIILYEDKDKLYETIKKKMIEANKILEN